MIENKNVVENKNVEEDEKVEENRNVEENEKVEENHKEYCEHKRHAGHGRYGEPEGHGRHSEYGEHNGHDEQDKLLELLSQSGHFLYHKRNGKNGQDRILKILAEYQSLSQSKLQEILHIQPGSMSEIIAKMEDKGLVSRMKDEADKRKVLVYITDSGMEKIKKMQEKREGNNLFAALEDKELEELERLLTKLTESWEETWGVGRIDKRGRSKYEKNEKIDGIKDKRGHGRHQHGRKEKNLD